MDEPAPDTKPKIKRWLPYWAVLQADLRQTLRSWIYRVWVLLSVLAATGYLLNRVGIYHGAGMIQSASTVIGELMQWSMVGSITLIIALAGGSISSEKGTMADSILSRGISRYQYFLGKWHSRMLAVLITFAAMGGVAVAGSAFFLYPDLSLGGGLVAMTTLIALLAVVTTCGVAVSAITNSTMVGFTTLWIILYGSGFALSWLPAEHLSPDRVLNNLPNILRGQYNFTAHAELVGWSAVVCVVVALVGIGYFSRRDV